MSESEAVVGDGCWSQKLWLGTDVGVKSCGRDGCWSERSATAFLHHTQAALTAPKIALTTSRSEPLRPILHLNRVQ